MSILDFATYVTFPKGLDNFPRQALILLVAVQNPETGKRHHLFRERAFRIFKYGLEFTLLEAKLLCQRRDRLLGIFVEKVRPKYFCLLEPDGKLFVTVK